MVNTLREKMNPEERKKLVLELSHRPKLPITGEYVSQQQIDAWTLALKNAGETDPKQICAALTFILGTYGLTCDIAMIGGIPTCLGRRIENYPPLSDGDDDDL